MQYESLRGDFSVCQNYNITPWKQISSTSLAVGITLLAMQCFLIKNALLWICQGTSKMVYPFLWDMAYYLPMK